MPTEEKAWRKRLSAPTQAGKSLVFAAASNFGVSIPCDADLDAIAFLQGWQ